jgi:hypothetical protein
MLFRIKFGCSLATRSELGTAKKLGYYITNVSLVEIHRQLMDVDAADVMKALPVRKWCRRFENCRTDFVDHDSIGRRVASTTNANTRKIEVLILGNRRNARKLADFRLTRKWK